MNRGRELVACQQDDINLIACPIVFSGCWRLFCRHGRRCRSYKFVIIFVIVVVGVVLFLSNTCCG